MDETLCTGCAGLSQGRLPSPRRSCIALSRCRRSAGRMAGRARNSAVSDRSSWVPDAVGTAQLLLVKIVQHTVH